MYQLVEHREDRSKRVLAGKLPSVEVWKNPEWEPHTHTYGGL